MKKLILSIFLCLGLSYSYAQQKQIVLEGTYQGENLIVDNPFAATGLGFCVYEINVNGQSSTEGLNSSSFEIDFANFKVKQGERVKLIIKHKDGCTPKVANPKILEPKSTFVTTAISMDKEGNLKWRTTKENGKLDFVVEQFKWNKWAKITTVEGKGTAGENSYSAKVMLHSGENRFRVKQTDYTKKPRYSDEAKFKNVLMAPVTFEKKGGKIVFSAVTSYEIFDAYGLKKTSGVGQEIEISKLSKGTYYLNYDNVSTEFTK